MGHSLRGGGCGGKPAPARLLETAARKQHGVGLVGQAAALQGAGHHLLHRLPVGAVHHAIQVVAPARRAGAAVGQRHAGLGGQGAVSGVYFVVGHIQHRHGIGGKAQLVVAHHHPKRLSTPVCSHCCKVACTCAAVVPRACAHWA